MARALSPQAVDLLERRDLLGLIYLSGSTYATAPANVFLWGEIR
jgi:hypothetical protein